MANTLPIIKDLSSPFREDLGGLKFLIIRFSSIGDIILTTPVIRCLRKKYPEASIHFLTKSFFTEILAPNPYLTKIHTLNADINVTIEELKKENFDCIIDLHHNIRTLNVFTVSM